MRTYLILFLLLVTTTVNATTINSIEFKNLSRLSPQIANESVGFKNGDELELKKVDEAIKKFYSFGYFTDIWVEEQGGNVVFYFKEKPTIGKLEINGYKTREEDLEFLYTIMNIKKGSMYSKKKIEYAKKSLLAQLESEGYINSVIEVETQNINSDSIVVTFNVNKGDEIIIKKVKYHGANKLSVDDFESVTANKEEDDISWWFGQNGGELKIDQLEYDGLRIKDKYYQNGFLDADIQKPFMSIDFASNQATLDFFIKEGGQYSVGKVELYVDEDIIDPNKLYDKITLNKNKNTNGRCVLPSFSLFDHKTIFNIKKLRKDIDMIKIELGNLGYAFAKVRYDIKKDKKTKIADVIYNVLPGEKVYINDVIISGNNKTLDRVVRRNIFLAPGDLYSETDFRDTKGALKRTGFFKVAKVEKKKVSDSLIDIIVTVEESPTGSLIVGGGYGSYDGWMFNASVGDKNIFGSGLSLDFSTQHSSKTDEFKLALGNPAIKDGKYSGSIDLHINKYEVDSTYYELNKKYEGAGIGVGRALNRFVRVGAKYRVDDVEEKYSNITDSTLVLEDDVYLLSSITPYISFNNTDDFYIPRYGHIAGASVEVAGHILGGDAKFNKYSTYYKFFCGLEDMLDYDAVFRYKARVKLLEDTGRLSKGDSFYLGGPSSVRGYRSYAFGPSSSSDPAYKYYFANSFEISLPLAPSARMRWAIFYDYGMIGIDDFNEIKKAGKGVLIEWFSPVGPLQFIFSRAINPDEGDRTSNFEFNLGGRF
jgi:outer membrane protein insertion porin family